MSDEDSANRGRAASAGWPPRPPLLAAIGQLPLLVFVPSDVSLGLPASPGLLTLIAGETALFLGLAGVIIRTTASLRDVGALLVSTAALGSVLALGLATTDALWLVAAAVLATVAVASYGLHRLTLVRLGLVTGESS